MQPSLKAPVRMRQRGPAPRPAPRGMTLVELVLAITILSIGMIAAWRSYEQAQRGIGGQVPRVLAQQVALNRAAELRLTGLPAGRALPGEVRMGQIVWQVSLSEAQTRAGAVQTEITVTAPGQPGARLTSFVPQASTP